MNRLIWLTLIVASEALLPIRAAALLRLEQTEPPDGQNEIEVAVSSVNGRTYLKTSFGRLPDGELRPNCIEDKDISLPIDFIHSWQVRVKRFPGGALSEVINNKEVLLEPVDPVEGTNALDIEDLMISNGPMTGKWRYKSLKTFEHGLLVNWTQEDNSSLQTFIPWAGIYSSGIERSQFDAPLCRTPYGKPLPREDAVQPRRSSGRKSQTARFRRSP